MQPLPRSPQPPGLLNVLVSYAYSTDDVMRMVSSTQGPVTWLLDSGAFTAFTQGREITLGEYMAFLAQHRGLFWQYIQLDTVGNPVASRVNLDRMVQAGLAPMPVFVLGDDEENIGSMIRVNTRVCVAGGVTESDEYYGPLLERLWRLSGGQADLHGLGYTRGMRVVRNRVATIDSSSWMSAMRWGSFTWFDRITGSFSNEAFKALRGKPWSQLPPRMQQVLVDSGVRPADLAPAVSMKGTLSLIGVQCAYAWLQYAVACAEHGTRFFFAVPNRTCLMALYVAARHARSTSLDWASVRDTLPEVREKLKDDTWLAEYVVAGAAHLRSVYPKLQGV